MEWAAYRLEAAGRLSDVAGLKCRWVIQNVLVLLGGVGDLVSVAEMQSKPGALPKHVFGSTERIRAALRLEWYRLPLSRGREVGFDLLVAEFWMLFPHMSSEIRNSGELHLSTGAGADRTAPVHPSLCAMSICLSSSHRARKVVSSGLPLSVDHRSWVPSRR